MFEMMRIVSHRGPDDEGVALFGPTGRPHLFGGPDTPESVLTCHADYAPHHVVRSDLPEIQAELALGHKRLAIIDRSPLGHQPMSYRQGRYWIVFNGEIYNYRELRAALEKSGHRLSSRTDTEVIMAAYEQWGTECLERFNGMWAFVLYDLEERELFVSRDRFGIKPLHYWTLPDGVVAFASEIKQFTTLEGWNARPDQHVCTDFLATGAVAHDNHTFFADVRQVRPGEYLHIKLDHAREIAAPENWHEWYTLPNNLSDMSFSKAVDQSKCLLADAVRLCLQSDVPVGSCLSGGLDSSSIVCLISRQLRQQDCREMQSTVSSDTQLSEYSEAAFISEVVRRTGVNSHFVVPDVQTLFPLLGRIHWQQDEPFGSTSVFAQWMVYSEAKRQGLTVMLDGQGADEYLAGYYSSFPPYLSGLLCRGRVLDFTREMRCIAKLHSISQRRLIAQTAARVCPPLEALRRSMGRRKSWGWLRMDTLDGDSNGDHFGYHGGEFCRSLHSFERHLLRNYLTELLRYADRNSMAHSVESRVPFLDHRLVELVLSMPDHFKIFHGETKHVLREAMRGVVPDLVRERHDKMGFVTPEEVWIRRFATESFRRALAQACEIIPTMIDPVRVNELFENVVSGAVPFDFTIWRIISLGNWAGRFSVCM